MMPWQVSLQLGLIGLVYSNKWISHLADFCFYGREESYIITPLMKKNKTLFIY